MHISILTRRKARTLSRLAPHFFLITATAVACEGSFLSSPERFDGTWEAVHDGKVIIVLRLHTGGEHSAGTIQLAGFQLDFEADGSFMAVTDDRLDTPINLKNIKQDGKVLSFDFEDRDGDNDKFQMELSNTNSAKLQWVGLPSGFKVLPIPLSRQRR
jgi:hypothetical protein